MLSLQVKKENGAFAIEAVLGLTFFMLAILSLMMVSLILRIEANMQYAVDQTAKELSSYYYLLDAVDIAKYTSGNAGSDATAGAAKANKLIDNVISFSDAAGDVGTSISDMENISIDSIGKIDPSNYQELYSTANQLWYSVKDMSNDPSGQVKAIISIFAHSLGNKAMSYYVTPYLCRMLMPNYLTGDLDSTNKYLDSIGIEGEDGQAGIEKIDFTHSSLLADGRTIKIVAIYKLNTKKLTFGMIDTDLYFEQTAVTAAWIEPNNDELLSIADAYKSN